VETPAIEAAPEPPAEAPTRKKQSLDDIIFDFLSAGDEPN
jgi:hypothetical protein